MKLAAYPFAAGAAGFNVTWEDVTVGAQALARRIAEEG